MEKIKVKTKKAMQDKIRELRADGYMIVTFGCRYSEMEKGDDFVVIARSR